MPNGSKVATLNRRLKFRGKPECKFPPRPPMQMPYELWRMVVDELPSLTGRHAAEAFGFKLKERHKKHSGVWNEIFRCDEEWGLNFILIGDDLRDLLNDPKRPACIALLTGDRTGRIRPNKTKFLLSLRPHDLNEKHEIVFHESNIILNVADALYNTFFTTLEPSQLFSCCGDNELRSASLYWQDMEYALRTIGPNDIVGVGGRASTLQSVSYTCGITLTHPKELALKYRHQHCFQHPDCPLAYTLLPTGCNYNGHNILGWELGDDHSA